MTNTYPRFDIENPHNFKSLSWRVQRELSEEDETAYEEEAKKHSDWLAQHDAERRQQESTFEEELAETQKGRHYRKIRALYDNPKDEDQRRWAEGRLKSFEGGARRRFEVRQDRARWLGRLAKALMNEGFAVKFMSGPNIRAVEVHPSWAGRVDIYRDFQKVGSYIAWYPKNSWQNDFDWYGIPAGKGGTFVLGRAIGWRIETNRWTKPRDKTRRLKSLDSAVKHIKETAIPTQDIEAELANAETEWAILRQEEGFQRRRVYEAEHGVAHQGNGKYEPDNTLSEIISAWSSSSKDEVLELVKKAAERHDRAMQAWADAELEAEKYHRETLNPLRKEAKEAMPEVYKNLVA
jgi:hypothetical protein